MAFPSRPGITRINRAHPANRSLRFSWAAQGFSGVDTSRGMAGSLTGTPLFSQVAYLGATLGNNNGLNYFQYGSRAKVAEVSFTMATICQFNAVNAYVSLFSSSSHGTNSGWRIGVDSNGDVQLTAGGVAIYDGPTILANVPYLIIASVNNGTCNFLTARMDTGAIKTSSVTVTTAPAAPDGTYTYLGALGAQDFDGQAATFLYSGQPFPAPALLVWAQDPWGPWRDTADIVPLLAKAKPAVTVTVPWPFFNMRAA